MQNTDKIKKLEEKINSIAQEIFDLHEDVGYDKKYVNPDDESRKDDVYKSVGTYKPQDYFFTGEPSERYRNLFTKLTAKIFEWANERKGDMYNQSGFGKNNKDFTFSYSVEMMNCAIKTIVEYNPQKLSDDSFANYFSNQLSFFMTAERCRERTEEATRGMRTTTDKVIQKLLAWQNEFGLSIDSPKFKDTVSKSLDIPKEKIDKMLQHYGINTTKSLEDSCLSDDGEKHSVLLDFIVDEKSRADEWINDDSRQTSMDKIMNKIDEFWRNSRKGTEDRASLVYTYYLLENLTKTNSELDFNVLLAKYEFLHKELIADFTETNKLPMKKELERYDSVIKYKYSKFEEELLNHLKNDDELKKMVDVSI